MVLYPNKLPESERVCSGICNSRIKCYVKAVRLFPRCKILDALLLTQYYATTDRFCSADHQ